jgi:integrase
MTMSDSTRKRAREKPAKPRPDFPLFPHATGRWAKKIRGRLHYFGPWEDPQGALQRYLREKDYLHAGRTPPAEAEGLTVRSLVNAFLRSKKAKMDRGELAPRTFRDLHGTCARLVGVFGRERLVADLKPADFEKLHNAMAKTLGLTTRQVEIQKTRSVFKWAYDEGLIDRPIRFGQGFRAPGKREVRRHKVQTGKPKRDFDAAEVLAMIDAAGPYLRAMILLGVNCGFGNHDCATLTLSAVDLDRGWIDHARPKTGTERRCPLWPETIQALREVIAKRRKPKNPAHKDLVFLTQQGKPWVRLQGDPDRPERATWNDSITLMCRRLLDQLGLKTPGRCFYGLRHTFETVAGGSIDQVAVNYLMGHEDQTMAGVYRERIDDARLETVVEHVRKWLFGEPRGS